MKEMKVLLVDDEEEFVKALSQRMKMRDVDSDVAFSGEEALKTMDEDLSGCHGFRPENARHGWDGGFKTC